MSVSSEKRKTKQKQIISKCLENNKERHLTAEEILLLLIESDTPVGRATVYRYLNALVEEGVLRRYVIKGEVSACYQYVEDNKACKEHYHMLCDTCGSVIHFHSDALENAFRLIEADNGLDVDHLRTVFYGECNACKNSKR